MVSYGENPVLFDISKRKNNTKFVSLWIHSVLSTDYIDFVFISKD
jgi:hypothetical protein